MTLVVEEVLVFPSTVLDRVGRFQGVTDRVEKYLDAIFQPGNTRFMERKTAEHSPKFKQLIPYVVLKAGREVFTYLRGGASSEERLRGMRSIGLGGHIQRRDVRDVRVERAAYLIAARREVAEEVRVDTGVEERLIGLINEDSTEVGRVHFGVLHLWQLVEARVEAREHQIRNGRFMPIDEVASRRFEYELWSQFALDVIRTAG